MQGILGRKDKVIKSRVTPLVVSMIKPEKNSNVPSLDWGKQNEINAAETFMKQEGIHHLVISKSHPYIGGTINQSIHLNLFMTRNIYNQI